MSDIALETATLAGGCFWCLEAVYLGLRGVEKVTSGYIGGHMSNPSYEAVCSGRTGHAEAVQILFNPAELSYTELLEVFFDIHDPTTLNCQGADVGTQYRSAIFFHSPAQEEQARAVVAKLTAGRAVSNPIVTTIEPAPEFWPAEDYHQDYFAAHPNQPYCLFTVSPKVTKFRKHFAGRLKQK